MPDDGPRRIHATAGAVMVGAREPLIAWNVWLPDATLDQARAIAARVREAGGGPPGLRALGLYLSEPGVAQVSMNLEDFRRTPPAVAVAAVRREAERLGIEAGDSELVGLIPATALRGPSPSSLRLRRFRPGQVLEAQLSALRRQPAQEQLAIAKKPRRRPTAGPPPVKNPRHEAKLADGGTAHGRKKLPAGAPVPPTFKSVVVRSVLASAIFLVFLTLTSGGSAGRQHHARARHVRVPAGLRLAVRPVVLQVAPAPLGTQARGRVAAVPPRGTRDILPAEARLRDRVTDAARAVFASYGYGRIQTPTFEETEVFSRGVGASTDIVRKEMYTFTDGSGRSLTLRPEGTAPVVRAFVENGMHKLQLPVKLWYLAPMFRYEAPQAGRYREHTQLGIEAIGSDDPLLDAEVICVLYDLYARLGVPGVTLKLASMGDPETHAAYRPSARSEYLEAHAERLRSGRARPHARQPAAPVRLQERTGARGDGRRAQGAGSPEPGGAGPSRTGLRGARRARHRLRPGPDAGAGVRLLHQDRVRVRLRPAGRAVRDRRRRALRRAGRGARRTADPGDRLRQRRSSGSRWRSRRTVRWTSRGARLLRGDPRRRAAPRS